MWKKITLVSLCLALVVGCGDKDDGQVKAISTSAGEGQQQVAEQKSGTAIYLPGGVGIDFGREPESDEYKEHVKGRMRVVRYHIESGYVGIDKALSELLASDGYGRSERVVPNKYDLVATYKKPGAAAVLVYYRESAKEGFSKQTMVTLSWRE